jgi:hypothetical protein
MASPIGKKLGVLGRPTSFPHHGQDAVRPLIHGYTLNPDWTTFSHFDVLSLPPSTRNILRLEQCRESTASLCSDGLATTKFKPTGSTAIHPPVKTGGLLGGIV